MNITLRLERPEDYRAVEELTREAFWGSMNRPTCHGEHLLVHKLRGLPSFVPELDYVAEVDSNLAGHIIYSLAKIITADDTEIEVLNFGPISVLPEYKRFGIGTFLMRHTIAEATRLGYRAIVFYGHPDYYPRLGYRRASEFGITSDSGKSFDALMAMPLYEGALEGAAGRYVEDSAFKMEDAEIEAFDQTFPPKEPVLLKSIHLLTDKLPEHIGKVFADRKIKHLAQLQGFSGIEMLEWGGVKESDMKNINRLLKEMSQPEKLLPPSPILQLTEMGVQIISLREWPARLDECQNLLSTHFVDNDFIKKQTAEPLSSQNKLPQGYFMLKYNKVIGWVGLIEEEPVSPRLFGCDWCNSTKDLFPWISPVIIIPSERGNQYGKLLLEHARRKAGRLGFPKVYLTTDHIGYFEKYGFREIGLTTFTWGRPTKIYEHDTIL